MTTQVRTTTVSHLWVAVNLSRKTNVALMTYHDNEWRRIVAVKKSETPGLYYVTFADSRTYALRYDHEVVVLTHIEERSDSDDES